MMRARFAAVDLYASVIAAIGAVLFVVCAVALWSTPHALEWTILGVLALVASRFPLRIPGNNAWFSISDTFFMASALLFGPGPATVTIALDSMAMSYAFRTLRMRRFLFNSGAPAIAFWIGAQVFYFLHGAAPMFGVAVRADQLVLPIGCFALVPSELGTDGDGHRPRETVVTGCGVALAFRRRRIDLLCVGIDGLHSDPADAVPEHRGADRGDSAARGDQSRDAVVDRASP